MNKYKIVDIIDDKFIYECPDNENPVREIQELKAFLHKKEIKYKQILCKNNQYEVTLDLGPYTNFEY